MTMRFSTARIVLALCLAPFAAPQSAFAQTVTPSVAFVSNTGSDASPCGSQKSPCASLEAAAFEAAGGGVGENAPGAEIDCLTPGSFGLQTPSEVVGIFPFTDPEPNTILRTSITINCPGGVVSNVVVGASGLTIVLRGIKISGALLSGSTPGIAFNGGTLVLDGVTVDCGGASGSVGLSINAPGNVSVTNSQFTGCSTGIFVQPSGGSGAALVALNHVAIEGNNGNGLILSASDETEVSLADSVVTNNSGDGVQLFGGGSRQFLEIKHTNVTHNGGDGIDAIGTAPFVLIGDSLVAWNGGDGIQVAGGALVFSHRNNQINGNGGTDVAGTVNTVPLQ